MVIESVYENIGFLGLISVLTSLHRYFKPSHPIFSYTDSITYNYCYVKYQLSNKTEMCI